MTNTSSSFYLLDERIQHFIWAEGWESLRQAQELAIPPILQAKQDVIVAAATAAGKTEAAFLPALTRLLQMGQGGLIIYVSPLKALINDQFGRLERLCEQLDIPVWPWHGDISSSHKAKFLAKPEGVLLITPESLEAMFCNRGTAVAAIFKRLLYIVIDELHAFIGEERGKQVQSLMHRIETAISRRVARIGLSATLGNMSLAAEYLRPNNGAQVMIIQSDDSETELRIIVKGYEEPVEIRAPAWSLPEQPESVVSLEAEEDKLTTPRLISTHLFKALRGSNNLIFPNSRREVERYTHLLAKQSDQLGMPNEFYPHHGSLSKEIREETERALKQRERPASAICTNTLELGIDIGAVKSIAQIGTPPSVASLRQRLGRSGRRKGEPAILRGYCVEESLSPKTSLESELRLGTVKMAAMISLLLEGWFEQPRTKGAHYSTLIQQILSTIAQYGGLTIGQIYNLLCSPQAPFSAVSQSNFVTLVRVMGERELLIQDTSGVLLHGRLGEKFVNHYTFYAAFPDEEEYRIIAGGRTLGTLPIDQLLIPGQRILFAGKTWLIEEIDEEQKAIYVKRASANQPPLFKGEGGRTHTKVRQRMRELLASPKSLVFLDSVAHRFLNEGRESYSRRMMATTVLRDVGDSVRVFTWLGDASNEALACLLTHHGFLAFHNQLGVEVRKTQNIEAEGIADALHNIALNAPPSPEVLLKGAKNLVREKWDWVLPEDLLARSYASSHLDLDEALSWLRQGRYDA
ncbi:MAG: DEAD/DEAH box helicase [Pseudomonadota bacterium]